MPIIKPRKDQLPILIAMPPVQTQQKRPTTVVQPKTTTTTLQSKSGQLQAPYNYHDIVSNYNPKQSPPPPPHPLLTQQYPQRQNTRKYQYT